MHTISLYQHQHGVCLCQFSKSDLVCWRINVSQLPHPPVSLWSCLLLMGVFFFLPSPGVSLQILIFFSETISCEVSLLILKAKLHIWFWNLLKHLLWNKCKQTIGNDLNEDARTKISIRCQKCDFFQDPFSVVQFETWVTSDYVALASDNTASCPSLCQHGKASSNQTLWLDHILLVIGDPLTPNQRWANKTCLLLLDVSASFLLYEYMFLSEKIQHFWPHWLLCRVTSWL